MKNNLFNFATKELSQDAFLCWCLNWYNNPESLLYPMAEELLELLGENGLPQGQELEILQQIKKIDILVILKEQSRAKEIIENCAHPDYRPMLREYLKFAEKGHEPQSMRAALAMHDTFLKKGDMRLTDFFPLPGLLKVFLIP